MSKLYGWGASVVILGALFKINHYPGADYMLVAGLGTEAIIFFFSAFEPPFVEPDWSLVYPELAGLYHGSEVDVKTLKKGKQGSLAGELDSMLAEAKIDQGLIESLGKGLKKMSESTAVLSDVSNAALATNEYVENVKGASKSVSELSSTYAKTSQTLNKDLEGSQEHISNLKNASQSAASLSKVYNDASLSIKGNLSATDQFSESIKQAAQSASTLSQKYISSAERISESASKLESIGMESKDFNTQMKKVSDNLAALNAMYELQLQGSNENVESNSKLQVTLGHFLNSLNESVDKTTKYQQNMAAVNALYEKQLQGTNKQAEVTDQMQKALDRFLENLNASANLTSKYKQEVDSLTQNLAALNKVYGNMLSAMNVRMGS
ncbi:MAG TPA: gliding motility protein GldL [Bacteroidales bacterium]|nr:gliding motility protein GldL [Bacteroidales bacterium]HNS45882.1 gliding motility protein GldL [Bacteroidales bacterium]